MINAPRNKNPGFPSNFFSTPLETLLQNSHITRLWMFPQSSLSSAEKVLSEICGCNVEVDHLHPLVQRAVAAAAALPDIQELYDRIPKCIESKLLAFQREGVRFVLQHGGRALLADEMELGKTLQMIQQWLDIPPSDIVVVFSQMAGSNRSGFTIFSSNSKGGIELDDLFNIISYDLVAKLENILIASDFKVVIADESHFLKNAQAKRTTASLPIIKLEVVKGKIILCKSRRGG